MVQQSACAKIILCGEHAVVYGRPAIALPLPQLRAMAQIAPQVARQLEPNTAGHIEIVAPDIGQHFALAEQPHHPLAQIVTRTLALIPHPSPLNPFTLTVTSQIPVSSHLGSGAAVSVACARAVAAHVGVALTPADASTLAFEVEKLHHGTPSGIDNTVIAYEQPIWFVRGEVPEVISHPSSLIPLLVVADTGIGTPTKIPVGDVRRAWERDTTTLESQFDEIAALVHAARTAMMQNDWPALGAAMNANHAALQRLGVSCAELDALCAAALRAGALGAKLSGGGRGGNIIALARDEEHAGHIKQTLQPLCRAVF
jgi:mevalonate kinase